MYNKKIIAASVATLFLPCVQAAQVSIEQEVQAKLIPDNYIVVFKTPTVLSLNTPMAVQDFAVQQGAMLENQYSVQVKRHFGDVLNGVLVKANKAQLKALKKNPNVKYVEQDQMVTIAPLAAGDQSGATWGLDRVDQRDLPLDNNYHYDYDGTGVTAYVVDTGVRNSHADFGGRATSGYDFVDNDSDASDCNGHGTHVAGTIGGSTWGVAKNVDIVGVRVLDCQGSGSYSGVIDGINWVKNNASGPSVANMSLGGGASQAVDDAVNAAVAAGVTFVVAAGNDNSNACNYSPARAADAITVGSTANNDARSSFSNYGSCLDIYAPGSSITSTWHTSNSATNTISGTSMAAPHVAGAAALLLDQTPGLTPAQVVSTLASRASDGKVSDAKTGSPNKLLYTLDGDGGGCTTDCPPGNGNELTNGQGVGVSGGSGSETGYFISVPADATNLSVTLAGGSGDGDLYVRYGAEPTTSTWDCRPYRSGNNETCDFSNPAAGDWYVMVRGYSSYSGATLTGTYTVGGGGGGCTSDNCLENGVPETNISGSRRSETFYTIDVPAGMALTVQSSGGSGDADLYVKAGGAPTTSDWDCRPYRYGNNETCNLTNGSATTYHIMLRGYSSYSGLTLEASY
ncbi:S8 family peptidase [Shewanella corallii]|uniref:S8 family peptidase n=1 Tax=Shewanella corallii TaxID=560080 RepID=A0ABT0NC50_9GAMM|nr:S8 family peptidase [Shewanella corallii]MCL2916062.1 S8 family peptidase [Shewanella corallii]